MGSLTAWLLACGAPVAQHTSAPRPAVVESCVGGIDEDGDGATDCADTDCAGNCPEDCANGRDDDGDAAVDCDDADCASVGCPERCDNGRDDDGDRVADCDDTDCDGACAERCADARDNDGDGATDCDDVDCDADCPESCTDGRDDDADGLSDCADPDCSAVCPEACSNLVDDDADGLVDCDDPACDASCDVDGDGHRPLPLGGDDCNDSDASVHPGAPEQCGNGDDDCDGLADDDDPDVDPAGWSWWHLDRDGDGFGRKEPTRLSCAPGPNLVGDDTDCADHHADTRPDGQEVCGDPGWDEDCDHLVDEADPSLDLSTAGIWFVDADGDGFGDPTQPVTACAQPDGTVADASDCFDDDPSAGWPLYWYEDIDGDGFGGLLVAEGCVGPPAAIRPAGDCRDDDPAFHPDAPERCDGDDDDCDLLADWDDDGNACAIDATSPLHEVAPADPEDPPWGYGARVAADDTTLVVGGDDGRAWVWDLAADPLLIGVIEGGSPGTGLPVAVSGDFIAVGDPDAGLVRVHRRTDLALDAELDGYGTGFGATVALTGERLAAARTDDEGGVRIWARTNGTWGVLRDEPSPAPGAIFGAALALSADWVAIGAPGLAAVHVGAAEGPLTPIDATDVGALALSDDRLAVGRPGLEAVDVWVHADDSWVLTDTLLPHAPAPGHGSALAWNGDLLLVGAPATSGIAVVWSDEPSGWREVAWLVSTGGAVREVVRAGPVPTPDFDVVCAPFGAGDGWGDYQGLVYSDLPAFHVNPGDALAFDLLVENDADIVVNIAMGTALVDGGDEPDGLVDVVRGARATVPRGNNVPGDFELAFTADAPFDFPGGGLVVRIEPTGPFRLDATCTDALGVTGADDPSGQLVERFYYEYDGDWPWTRDSTTQVAPMEIRLTGRPAFGSAVAWAGEVAVVGAPATPPPPVEAEGDVPLALPAGSVSTVAPLDVVQPW